MSRSGFPYVFNMFRIAHFFFFWASDSETEMSPPVDPGDPMNQQNSCIETNRTELFAMSLSDSQTLSVN